MTGQRKVGLPPIVDSKARILILGTLPGDASIASQRYYGHPQNAFWPLMSALLAIDWPESYEHRCTMLSKHGIAVWDVLHCAERAGSLDTAIRAASVNDFAPLVREAPNIETIVFNGQKAHELFRRHVLKPDGPHHRNARMLVLPSTSPTNVVPFEQKLAAWRSALAPLIHPRAARSRKA